MRKERYRIWHSAVIHRRRENEEKALVDPLHRKRRMASAELERSHSAMGSLSTADKTSPSKSPTKVSATVLERSASSSSGSSSAAVNNNNNVLKRPQMITASERLQEHRSRMHRHASTRRPLLTSTASVDGTPRSSLEAASRSTSSLDVPATAAAHARCGGRGPRATSPFVESSREAAEVRLRALAEIKALQVRRNDSFKRGSPVLSGGAGAGAGGRQPRQPRQLKIDEGKSFSLRGYVARFPEKFINVRLILNEVIKICELPGMTLWKAFWPHICR